MVVMMADPMHSKQSSGVTSNTLSIAETVQSTKIESKIEHEVEEPGFEASGSYLVDDHETQPILSSSPILSMKKSTMIDSYENKVARSTNRKLNEVDDYDIKNSSPA